MAFQAILTGPLPAPRDDGATGAAKINANFTELYSALSPTAGQLVFGDTSGLATSSSNLKFTSNRLLVNGPTDDGTTNLQVNGFARTVGLSSLLNGTFGTQAIGENVTDNTTVVGSQNTLIGTNTYTSGGNQSLRNQCTIIGYGSGISSGGRGTIIGVNSSIANSFDCTVIGSGNAITNAPSATVVGSGTTTNSNSGVAIGFAHTLNNANSLFGIGNQCYVDAADAASLGWGNYNGTACQLDFGSRRSATGQAPSFRLFGTSSTIYTAQDAWSVVTSYLDNTAATGRSRSIFNVYEYVASTSTAREYMRADAQTGGKVNVSFLSGGDLVTQAAALATNATTGFTYMPTCAGAPTGVPTGYTGTCATVYDTTNNKLWVYNGAWKGVVLA